MGGNATGGSATGGNAGSANGGGVGVAPGIDVIRGDACVITAPAHWAAGVHVADCVVDVESSLTIDPGAIIKFGPRSYLSVRAGGRLTAVGTDSLPIIFTSLKDDSHGGDSGADGATTGQRGDWGCEGECGGVTIKGDGSVLKYVQALYGTNGVYVQAASTELDACTFAHQKTSGLVLDGGFGVETTVLGANVFFDNQDYPLRLGKPVFVDGGNVFHDPENPSTTNGKQCILLDTDLDRIVVLAPTEIGFLFSGHRISAEVLTPAGVVFKSQGAAIRLEATGTFLNGPTAIFTSYKDDSVGGDCTGDGATAPAVGDWEGLWIEDGTKSDYAAPVDTVRYAAKSGTMPIH